MWLNLTFQVLEMALATLSADYVWFLNQILDDEGVFIVVMEISGVFKTQLKIYDGGF